MAHDNIFREWRTSDDVKDVEEMIVILKDHIAAPVNTWCLPFLKAQLKAMNILKSLPLQQ
jgi:hypothetical protein